MLRMLPIALLFAVWCPYQTSAQDIGGRPGISFYCIGGAIQNVGNQVRCSSGYSVNSQDRLCVNGTWVQQVYGGAQASCSSGIEANKDLVLLLEALKHRQTSSEKLDKMLAKVTENTTAMSALQMDIKNLNVIFVKEVQETITKRFASIPAEVLVNDAFKAELEKLRKQIMEDVEAIVVKKDSPPE